MSKNWVEDLADMHKKYGMREWLEENRDNPEMMKKLIEFRLNFLMEELLETYKAHTSGDSEEMIDGLIDMCVVAIGTLDFFDIDTNKAWDEVHSANMKKERGVKPGRPNPLGLPDLMKPGGWQKPSHKDNHGVLTGVYENDITNRTISDRRGNSSW